MVAVGFTVGGDMNQLGPVPILREGSQQTLCQPLSVIENSLESHAARDRTNVEEERDRAIARQPATVGSGRIDFLALDIVPILAADLTDTGRLARGEDRE